VTTAPVFPKPTFTVREMLTALGELAPRLPRLVLAAAGPRRVDPHLREVVMMAVSEANKCRYCLTAHGELARGAGVTEEELGTLHERRWQDLPPRDRAAVISALRRAGFGIPDAPAEDIALEEHFLPSEVAALAALVDAIRIANLSGNTVDMLLARVTGAHRPRRDSSLLSELAVSGLWALGAAPASVGIAAAAAWRRLKGERD